MTTSNKTALRKLALVAAVVLGALLLAALPSRSQTSASAGSQAATDTKQERWIHVRVDGTDSKEEKVRVNVPLELAEKVLPAINKDRLKSGKVKITEADVHGVDIHALVAAVRNTKDGEFVTVQSKDNDVRVAKQGGYFLVHVMDKEHSKKSRVEVKVPIKVVDALFSGAPDEIDLVAGLRALSAEGDTELVSVKDDGNNVRVWLDSKNSSD